MPVEVVATPRAPTPVGPYSQAIRANGLVFCSGQLGIVPASGTLATGGITAETRQALHNLAEVLAAAGSSLTKVVKTTVFLVDLADAAEFNKEYGTHFTAPLPTRSLVQVARLPLGARIEIEAVAVL